MRNKTKIIKLIFIFLHTRFWHSGKILALLQIYNFGTSVLARIQSAKIVFYNSAE